MSTSSGLFSKKVLTMSRQVHQRVKCRHREALQVLGEIEDFIVLKRVL